MVISNHNSFRVLFDKLLPYILCEHIYLYFSSGNGQPREPALCQLYRHTFVPSLLTHNYHTRRGAKILFKKGKGSPYSITKRRAPELIPVLGSQPAGEVGHKPGGRLPLLSARPAVTLATLKTAATNFAAWWTEARWVWTVCLRLLPDSVAAAIWTQALLRLSLAR